ncbi:MAG TPA: DUF2460 domain-containing protein [Bryobacteraceae bacterium]|jgi:hypothetical protein
MATFPVLSSGAVMQYPAPVSFGRPAQVIRFIDGTDQRFIARGRALRSWQIKLNLLSEFEIAQIEAFFQAQAGEYSAFDFPDPFSGTSVPNCRLGGPGLPIEYEGVDISSTSFLVIETNG